jgi:hydrogenase maturation protein HypF
MWLEHLATGVPRKGTYPFPFFDSELDFRPLLEAVIFDRLRGRDPSAIARAFQAGIAEGLFNAADEISARWRTDAVVLSGGVFQNQLLLSDLKDLFANTQVQVWINRAVPANDGGISLGQAAMAAMMRDASRSTQTLQAVRTTA